MNTKVKTVSIVIVLSLLVLAACTTKTLQPVPGTATPKPAITNPAAANCEMEGYRYQIRTTADGSQYGVCIFPDESECEEWAFFRGECAPVPENPASGTDNSQITNPASVNCEQKGGSLETRTAADGSQAGVCVFPDGSECDEWALFRDECAPGSNMPSE